MISALTSLMPAPGLVMPAATACLADAISRTTTAAAMRADDLGDDVADAIERRQASIEDDPDRHGRVEVAARDVTEREDRGQQSEPERERHDQEARCRRRLPSERGDRHVADHHEHECAEQFRQVNAVRSWSLRLRPWAGCLHNSERGPRRANQQRIAPGPAEDLDELEAVDRVVGIGADGHGAVALEQDR